MISGVLLDTLQVAAISFALSQLVLSALLLAGSRRWVVQQRLYALLLVSIACYLLDPVFSGPVPTFILTAVTVAVPGMFWLFSASLFDDHFKLERWHIALVAATVVPPFIGLSLRALGIDIAAWLLFTLPQILEFVLLALTLFVVARHWHTDLIESRRRLRLWFSGLNGLYIFILLLFREVFFVGEEWLNTLQFVPVGGILLATNAILLVYRQDIWSGSQPRHGALVMAPRKETNPSLVMPFEDVEPSKALLDSETNDSANNPSGESVAVSQEKVVVHHTASGDEGVNDEAEIDPRLMADLNALMEDDKAYREMGLTIGKLAVQLDIPEYRLRQLINTGLGYRNFNDFLNQFRIREASERLADSDQRDTQILVIALDTGFRSLSSFNKAFKATYEVTPTAYRKSHLNL